MDPTQLANLDEKALALVVRWNFIVSLLSMDVVVPFYAIIGLRIPNDIPFRDILRKLILDGRREFPETDLARVFLHPDHILGTVAKVYGDALRGHLEAWGTHIFRFSMEEHLALWHWKQVLSYAARSPEAWASLQISASLDHEFLRRFLASKDREEYDNREQQLWDQPLSDWDLHMYALKAYNDDDPYPLSGPSSYLYHVAMVYQGFEFWAWVFQHLNDEDLVRIQKNAVAYAQSGNNLTFIKELPLPDIKGFQV